MSAKTDIELALADLEAGKFSFRMVETIKDYVSTLENDLACAKTESESAAKTLRQQEFTIARLEMELRKVNARVHALLRANALTETALREGKHGALALRDLLIVVSQHAVELSKKSLASLSTVDAKGKADMLTREAKEGFAKLDLQAEWEKLKAHPLTEKALRELQSAFAKAQENLPAAQKQLAALVEKATAFIQKLSRNAA